MTETERKQWIRKARLHISYLEKKVERLEAENYELRAENSHLRQQFGMTQYEQV